MDTAYVIMPYAKEFERVYRNLIKPAVEQCDLECVRTDKEAKGGQVMKNVIADLAAAKIVIADISSCNWNVAYELGIRHALIKKGTVLICNDSTQFPFDISGYNIIQYATDWLDKNLDDDIIEQLVARIKLCMSSSATSDSPVHDQFSRFPDNLKDYLYASTDMVQMQVKELQEHLEDFQNRNASLQQLVDQAGLEADSATQQPESTESLILAAIDNSKYVSETAVNTLQALLDDGKKEEFARFLSKVLDMGYLDETDCRNVFMMCRALKNPAIVRIFLERAVEFYPDSEELQGYLADTYSDDYRTREKALSMANTMLGLVKKNGVFELTLKARSARMIASFFNAYIGLKKYNEITEIGFKLLDQSPLHKTLIRRNIVNAYIKLELYDKAEEQAKILLSEAPEDDQIHYCISELHHVQHRFFSAYRELEKCIACDNEDPNYYYMIACLICDEKVARGANGEYIHITRAEKEQYAVPFLVRAVSIDTSFLDKMMSLLRGNHFHKTLERLESFMQNGNGNLEDAFGDLDFSAVDACMHVDCKVWEEHEKAL